MLIIDISSLLGISNYIFKHNIMSSIYTKTYPEIFPQSMLSDVTINTQSNHFVARSISYSSPQYNELNKLKKHP